MEKKWEQDKKQTDLELQARLQHDFVVKNMPSLASFSGASYNSPVVATPSAFKKELKKNSFSPKSTGIIIIAAGLVIIGILFYVAYRFLIVPAMNPDNNLQNISTPPIEKEINEPIIPVEEASSSVPEIVPIIDLTAGSSSATVLDLNLPVLIDTDNDGLSDEAEAFLGTNPQLSDSDNDTYSDKQEILGAYNPIGAGKLSDNSNLALYADTQGLFALIYPNLWQVSTTQFGTTLFAAPDQSFIQIAYEDGEQDYTDIIAWYRGQFADVDTLSADRFLTSNLGPGILSADQQIAYFLDKDGRHVFVLSYIKSGEGSPYQDIFRMMSATLMRL
jgi:hypothetical protein